MNDTINVADYSGSNFKEIRLKTLMQSFALGEEYPVIASGDERYLQMGRSAIRYLKSQNEYRPVLEMCLKKFDRVKKEEFGKKQKNEQVSIYKEIVVNLGKEIQQFAAENLNRRKAVILDFSQLEKQIYSANREKYDFYLWYGFDVLEKPQELLESPHDKPQKLRIFSSSKANLNRLEGKVRKIAKFACIDEAFKIIQRHINLQGQYTFRKMVDDLDELLENLIIDSSSGMINSHAVSKGIDALVDEALSKYEVVSKPEYLINSNAYRSAIRKKLKDRIRTRF